MSIATTQPMELAVSFGSPNGSPSDRDARPPQQPSSALLQPESAAAAAGRHRRQHARQSRDHRHRAASARDLADEDGDDSSAERLTPAVAAAAVAYTQMPMRAFMTPKDWRELLTKQTAGKLAKCKASRNKYNRMLYSYHRLYQEYQYICTCLLLPSKRDGGDDKGDGRAQGTAAAEAAKHAASDDEAAAAGDSKAASGPAHASFGSVLMSDRNFRVQRCSKRRSVVCHRVLTRAAGGAAVWLDLPIAVELLLPRLQEQIRSVTAACPHVSDPLEVLAELRANRYDTERCVGYLRETLPLREVVRDIFLSARSGRHFGQATAAVTDSSAETDQRQLRLHIANLISQLRPAAAQLLLNSVDSRDLGVNKSNATQAGDPLPDRLCSLMSSLEAVSFLLEADGHQLFSASPSSASSSGSVGSPSPSSTRLHKQKNPLLPLPPPLAPSSQPNQQRPTASLIGDASLPTEDSDRRPLLRVVRQLKADMLVLRASISSVASAMVAGLSKVRCHLSTQQERCRRGKDNSLQHQQATVANLQKYVEELRLKCKEEESRRRQVFNALQEQLGNIRVYCRCTRIDGEQAVEPAGPESVRVHGQQQDEVFRFDRVFGPDAEQESLFEELRPLITSFLDGFNVCFITYGGEASGKTFTLLGSSKQRGLVYRALLCVLQETARRAGDWSMELDSACLEIYNDACYDMLSEREPVSLYKDCSLGSMFTALRLVPIREERDVVELLRVCSARRRVAKTALNPRSSRSHLVHLVRLQARSRVHGHTACSYLGMMDLAGAENIVKADTWHEPVRAAEAGNINRSLAAFNRLFLTLRRTPPSAACYREARLTQMLKPFLVNHGKCCIIVTVRTDAGSVSTTMSTLRFGRDTRQVALGKAQRQLVSMGL